MSELLPVFGGSRTHRWVARLIGIAFAFLVLGAPACAGDPPNAAGQAQPPLRVATSGDYPPFSLWPDSERAPRGFSPDLARAFARSSGRSIEWVRFDWPELETSLRDERFDLALSGITVRADRAAVGRFSTPLTVSGALVLVPDEAPARRAADLDAPGVRLAVNAGGHLERVARLRFPKATIEPVADNADVLARLAVPGVTGVVTDTLEAPLWQRRRPGLRRIGPISRDRKAALFPVGGRELARRFDRWLLEAERTGELAGLRSRYALPERRTAEPIAALLAAIDERLSLMPAVARVKHTLAREVEDRDRERRVIEVAWRGVEREAALAGRRPPDEASVRRLFRAQIEAAKWIQTRALRDAPPSPADAPPSRADATTSRDEAARRAARNELEQVLRPALLRIGDRIAALIARVPDAGGPTLAWRETSEALRDRGLPEDRLRAIHAALVSLLRSESASASATPRPAAAADRSPSA